MNMKEFKKTYIEKQNQYEKEAEAINEKIEKRKEDIRRAERSIQRLNKKFDDLRNPSWIQTLVKPIGEAFAKDFNMEYEIYGPFGIRAQVTIYWRKDIERSITEQPIKALSLIPLNLAEAELGYETGRKREGVIYPSGSLGAMNGMDREVLPLPDCFEEIRSLIRSSED
ncbi:hypothetical protein D7X33_46215 [Butyricicoccus sp. 1XD8-22]|nr:hypothetical protein D7X33_46215 [Butyricicoccus sp. 1XD8-22]